jgi:WD40 repeat protein
VWEVATGKQKHAVKGFPFEPGLTDDGKWVVTGYDETTVKVWDVETGKEVGAFAGHKKAVRDCWVSNDRKRLVTFDRSGSARLWDAATGKEVRVIDIYTALGRPYGIEDIRVQVSSDARLLVGWTAVRLTLWDLENGKAIRSLRR